MSKLPELPYENGFYMAVIGDNDGFAEPVRIEDGHWYSTGCADPHSLNSIRVVQALDTKTATNAKIEADRKDEELRQRDYEKWAKAYRKKYGRAPGHRRWATASMKGGSDG